jgi:hypothetical protein
MLKRIVIVFFICCQLSATASQKVYLVHGYGSPKEWLHKINKTLKKEHFETENYGYHSMIDNLDTLGYNLYQDIKHCGYDTVSFVTHSMGALVVRSMLQYSLSDTAFPVVYRFVMITPPNNGATVADFYSSFKFLNPILGPNVALMRTDSGSYVHKLPVPIKTEIGIVVGVRKGGKFDKRFSGDNDGVLTPEQAELGTEKDMVIVRNHHIRVPKTKQVRKLVVEFLQYGKFVSK